MNSHDSHSRDGVRLVPFAIMVSVTTWLILKIAKNRAENIARMSAGESAWERRHTRRNRE